ncbi:MAG: hypothetical protein BroJett021_11610 [Chloroflexota bacterium]|nr:hypothetical protein [Caldilinea sp.]GIK72173.1 MAG: hypothetical protein BroJett021_11610 [Chloroflexota bacterium]
MYSNQRQSMRTWLLPLIAFILAFSLAACGGAPEPTPMPTPTPTPTATPTPVPTPTPEAVSAVGAATTAGIGATEIVVNEQQINEQLQAALGAQQDLPVTNVAVSLEPGLIVGTGKLALGFINSDVKVSVRLNAVNGKVIPEVVEILLDGNPVPAMLKGQIDSLTRPYIEEASSADYGFYVESVEITDNELRIVGR